MMTEYEVELLEDAKREMGRLDISIGRRVLKRLHWLRQNLDSITPQALTGNLTGLYKLRIGDYRVVYEIIRNERLILVHSVGHRRDVYRRK